MFESAELFKEPEIALSICDSPDYEVLNLTPKQLYNEIKNLASKRYQYNLLPKKMSQLKILESHENKFSVLRDICITVGITINFRGNGTEDKHYILENDPILLKKYISENSYKEKATE